MNPAQKLYYDQALSDLQVFDLLASANPCHRLHYLQMLTEKLGKAYFYGKSRVVTKSHAGLRKFFRSLVNEPKIWSDLGFKTPQQLWQYLDRVNHLVIQIERMAPALCSDGPNPEYPWPPPPAAPLENPVGYEFPLWKSLEHAPKGRQFLEFVRKIIAVFPRRF